MDVSVWIWRRMASHARYPRQSNIAAHVVSPLQKGRKGTLLPIRSSTDSQARYEVIPGLALAFAVAPGISASSVLGRPSPHPHWPPSPARRCVPPPYDPLYSVLEPIPRKGRRGAPATMCPGFTFLSLLTTAAPGSSSTLFSAQISHFPCLSVSLPLLEMSSHGSWPSEHRQPQSHTPDWQTRLE